ncbi:MAG: dipeptide ABC transporter ATP-binding protein [Fuerstiella sp.]
MALLEVRNLSKSFPIRGGLFNRQIGSVQAVRDVSFSVNDGETVGIIGESGCGKSTLGKAIVGLHEPTGGYSLFSGLPTHLLEGRLRKFQNSRLQFIFQDPYSSLNPRMTAGQMLAEAIRFHATVSPPEEDDYIDELLAMVQLRGDARHRYPHEFSGGQRQRLNIARALAVRPKMLIADEPVSALDVSVQAQILNLLMDLRERLGLTILFISHDLKVVEHFCDRMVVMYLGKVVEQLACDNVYEQAKHPYTRALLKSNPINDPTQRGDLFILEGEVPSPQNPPPGCPFVSRCELVEDRCHQKMPPLKTVAAGQRVACWPVIDPAPKP